MNRQATWLLIVLLLAGCSRPAASQTETKPQPQSLPTTKLTIGSSTFTLQIADDDEKRRVGLMHRRSMPEDEGMLFLFTNEVPRSFWMKNTPIDLDILYLDRHGKIVSIKTMYAYNESPVPSEEPAMFAIELNAGVAQAAGLSVGLVVDIPEALRKNVR